VVQGNGIWSRPPESYESTQDSTDQVDHDGHRQQHDDGLHGTDPEHGHSLEPAGFAAARQTGSMVVVGVAGLALIALAVGGLTAMGARRRGSGYPLAALAGLCFPITWTVWYVRDQHPYRHRRGRTVHSSSQP
jgi:hypothetical protein